ncbi:unnamed protein product [Ilex paraguariensis]|uniref:S-acyltransferase n=1 Tax=Ilex paraguariensis TaxID=185542 RepID=A0ABC8RQF8_9AQUA
MLMCLQRNYRLFIFFISSTTTLCIYVFTFSLLDILQQQGSVWNIMSRNVVSVILVVYSFIAVWFVGGLSALHAYLICTNKTTYESFRYWYDKRENPYNQGIVKNIKEFIFSKTPPSLVNFREWVIDKDDTTTDSINQKFGGDIFSSKWKVDIEMGGMLTKDASMPLPNILQNLDYKGIDDNLKKDGGGNVDQFFFPTVEEVSGAQRTSTNGYSPTEEDRSEDGSSQQNSSVIQQE